MLDLKTKVENDWGRLLRLTSDLHSTCVYACMCTHVCTVPNNVSSHSHLCQILISYAVVLDTHTHASHESLSTLMRPSSGDRNPEHGLRCDPGDWCWDSSLEFSEPKSRSFLLYHKMVCLPADHRCRGGGWLRSTNIWQAWIWIGSLPRLHGEPPLSTGVWTAQILRTRNGMPGFHSGHH